MTRRFGARALVVCSALVLAACFGDQTGPGNVHLVQLNVRPHFDVHAIRAVNFDKVRVVVNRPGNSNALVDTTVAFPANADTVELPLHLALSGPSEDLEVTMFYLDDPGSVLVFKAGPTPFTATEGSSATTVDVIPLYVGPGAAATKVVITQVPPSVFFGDTATFTAQALDASNNPIAGTPIIWTSLDSKTSVPDESVGKVVGGSQRGSANIQASLLMTSLSATPPADTAAVVVAPKPNQIAPQTGVGQVGTVGAPLATAISFRVKAADNLGVQGAIVAFSAPAGSLLSATTDTTDANGDVSVSWTLPTVPGSPSVTATVTGVAGLTSSVSATANVGPATQLAFTVQPSSVQAFAPITPAMQVAARDQYGNPTPAFVSNVTVAIGTNPGGATIGGTTSVAAVAGVATFSNVTLSSSGTGYTLVASATGLSSATSGGLTVSAPANLISWINPAGGNWSVGANWSRGTVPVAGDTVNISLAGNYTVTLDLNTTITRLEVGGASGTQTLQINVNNLVVTGSGAIGTSGRLNLGGGSLAGAGLIDVLGQFNWTGGTLGGSGGTLRVLAGGTHTSSGTTGRTFVNHTLELDGSGTWSGTHTVGTGQGAVLLVAAGGTLDLQGDETLTFNQGGASPILTNLGTVTRSTSAGTFILSTSIGGGGAWTVNSGTLELSGGGTATGTLTSAGGATLRFNGSTMSLGAGSNVTGAGAVEFNGGTVTIGNNYAVTGPTRVLNAGTVNFNGSSMNATSLDVSGGTLGGSAFLTVSGPMTWSAGNLAGGGGTTRVLASGSLAISGTTNRSFTAYALEQASATGTWTGTAQYSTGLSAVLRIVAGGSLDVQGTPLLTLNQGGTALLDNQGTLLKSGGGTFQVTGAFNSTGTVTATNGTLQLAGGGTLAGTMTAATGVIVNLGGGSFTASNGFDASGVGRVQLTAGALVIASATDTARFTTLELNGGTLSQTGVVRPSVLLDWTGGTTVSGTGKVLVPVGSAMNLSGAAGRFLTNGIVENNATATWSGTFQVNTGQGAVLRNMPGATFNLTGDGLFSLNQGGVATFDNQGTFIRTTSGNSINWTVAFNQVATATSNINTGTFVLSGGGTHQGAFAVSGGAFLDYSAGTYVFSAHQASGAGTVRWQGATLNTASATDSAKFTNLQLNSGTIAETGVVRVGGLLDWAGSTVISGTGKIAVPNAASMTITGTAGRTFTNGTIEVAGTTTWSGLLQINTGLNAVFRNLPSGNFILSGDGTFTQNQGFPQALFDNQGTFARNTSAGLSAWSVFFQDTVGTTSVVTGTLALSGGGRLGGTFALSTGAILDMTSGTFSARPATAFTGAGLLRASGGSLFDPDSASAVAPVTNAVTAASFDLTGTASLAHEGLFIVGTTMNWTGGTIASNVAGTGGTTRITGTMNISNAGGVTLSGAHTLDNQGTVNYTGAGAINTGLGPVINNGGNWVWSGNGSIINNQGAPTIQWNNVGNLQRTTSATGVTLDAVMNKTGGFNIATGTLILPRGSVTAFQGNVNGTGTLDLSGGTFTQTATMPYAGNLILSGGTLVLNGFAAGVTGNFTTSGGGNVVMTAAADSLDINGNASFGGGTGTLSNGVIHAAGNFTQTGVATYQPGPNTSPQRVVLDGAGTQTLTFATTVNSFFRRLEINKSAGNVTLGSDVKASWVHLVNNTAMTLGGAFRLLTDTLSGTNFSATVSPLVVENTSVLTDSGAFLPDTAVFTGTAQSIPNGTFTQYAYKSIRIAQASGVATWNLATNRTLPNDLIVSSGTLNLSTHRINVTGAFRTEATGVLRMQSAGDSLLVGGNAIFAGGSTTGQITAGATGFAGNFTQGGGAADAFAPSGTHHSSMGSVATAQSISFANPTTSFFDALDLPATTHTVTMQTNMLVNDSLIISGGGGAADLVTVGTTQRLRVNGVISIPAVTASGRLAPAVLEMGGSLPPVIGNISAPRGMSADTTVYLGALATLPVGPGIHYNHLRIGTAGAFTMAVDTIAGDFVVNSGTATFSAAGNFMANRFRTQSGGAFTQTVAGSNVIVVDSAVFGGGASAPSAGTFQAQGNFVQQGGAANAYAPTGTHSTVISSPAAGTNSTSILFANPTTSFFNAVTMSKGVSITRGTVTLLSDARANGACSVANSTDLRGANMRFTCIGQLSAIISTTSPTINTLRAIEMSTAPNVTVSGVTADTIVFNGAIANVPSTGFTYDNIRANTTGTLTFANNVTLAHDLDVATGVASFPGTVTINGKLRVRGSGAIAMPVGGGPLVTVADSAIFTSTSASTPQTGNLRLLGSFNATGGAYQPSFTHLTTFAGNVAGGQRVFFSSPGVAAGNSWFGTLMLARAVAGTSAPVGVNLTSNVFVTQQVQDSNTATGVNDSIFSAGNVLTTTNFSAGGSTTSAFVFNNTTVVLSGYTIFSTSGLTFRNMNPTSIYLTLNRNVGGADNPNGVAFQTVPTGAGRYFNVNSSATGAVTVTFVAPVTPATGAGISGLYVRNGSPLPTVVWAGSTNP